MSFSFLRTCVRLMSAFYLLMIVALWSGCGGSQGSSSSNPGTSASSSSQPGGGSGSGTSSGSGGSSGGNGGSSGSGGANYLYVAVDNTSAAILGYKVDTSGATLAEVAGSPFALQGGSPGIITASKNFVYSSFSNAPGANSTIAAFRADASSGTLTQVGSMSFTNTGQPALFSEPSGRNLYALDATGDIVTYDINPDGTLSSVGAPLHLADGVGSFAVSPNGQLAYAVITNGNFKAGTLTDAAVVLNRDPSSGSLSNSRQVNSQQHLLDLQFDTAGRYLLAISGTGEQVSVYSVDYSTGNLTPVAGSPFAATRSSQPANAPDFIRAIRLDPSGRFLYALDGNEADPRAEYVQVLSFTEATGTLAAAQTFTITSGTNPTSIDIDPSVVTVVNSNSGFTPSSITVLHRDPNTGMLSAGGSPVTVQNAINESAEVHF